MYLRGAFTEGKLFALRIITWNYDNLLRIISYLKPFNCLKKMIITE